MVTTSHSKFLADCSYLLPTTRHIDNSMEKAIAPSVPLKRNAGERHLVCPLRSGPP